MTSKPNLARKKKLKRILDEEFGGVFKRLAE